jgi:spore germination protein YaaH
MKRSVIFPLVFILLSAALITPASAHAAAAPLQVSGWIPYWRIEAGTADAMKHLDTLTNINPFGFTVKSDGKLADTADLRDSNWQRLFKAARKKGITIIPTVMWSDTASIDTVLRSSKLRAAHVKAIAAMVSKGKYDGVDIDYEGKKAETMPYYSQFLKELKAALKGKTLACTIEARTPPDSLYTVVPTNMQYANDYTAINQYCDTVQLMTYDQQNADIKLNAAAPGLYAPLADSKWVEKVVTLAQKTIDPKKISLGVATYGREYDVTVNSSGYLTYQKLDSFNPQYALDQSALYSVTPSRNRAGEMSVTYPAATTPAKLLTTTTVAPLNTATGDLFAAKAAAYAKSTKTPVTYHMLWWSDAGAIGDKVALAKKYGLNGISIFKIDGGEDQQLWSTLK